MTGIGAFVGLLIGLPYELDQEFKAGYEWWRVMFLLTAALGVLHVLKPTTIDPTLCLFLL